MAKRGRAAMVAPRDPCYRRSRQCGSRRRRRGWCGLTQLVKPPASTGEHTDETPGDGQIDWLETNNPHNDRRRAASIVCVMRGPEAVVVAVASPAKRLAMRESIRHATPESRQLAAVRNNRTDNEKPDARWPSHCGAKTASPQPHSALELAGSLHQQLHVCSYSSA